MCRRVLDGDLTGPRDLLIVIIDAFELFIVFVFKAVRRVVTTVEVRDTRGRKLEEARVRKHLNFFIIVVQTYVLRDSLGRLSEVDLLGLARGASGDLGALCGKVQVDLADADALRFWGL